MSDTDELIPTCENCYVQHYSDALLIIKLVADRKLPLVRSGPPPRADLIKSGNVFVYDSIERHILLWSDGFKWTRPTIADGFSVYEMQSSSSDDEDSSPSKTLKRARYSKKKINSQADVKRKARKGLQTQINTFIRSREKNIRRARELRHLRRRSQPDESEDARENNHNVTGSHSQVNNTDDSSDYSDSESGDDSSDSESEPSSQKPFSRKYKQQQNQDQETHLEKKTEPLIKKTICVEHKNTIFRLIAYYLPEDVKSGALKRPSEDPKFLQYMEATNQTIDNLVPLSFNGSFNENQYSQPRHPDGFQKQFQMSGMIPGMIPGMAPGVAPGPVSFQTPFSDPRTSSIPGVSTGRGSAPAVPPGFGSINGHMATPTSESVPNGVNPALFGAPPFLPSDDGINTSANNRMPQFPLQPQSQPQKQPQQQQPQPQLQKQPGPQPQPQLQKQPKPQPQPQPQLQQQPSIQSQFNSAINQLFRENQLPYTNGQQDAAGFPQSQFTDAGTPETVDQSSSAQVQKLFESIMQSQGMGIPIPIGGPFAPANQLFNNTAFNSVNGSNNNVNNNSNNSSAQQQGSVESSNFGNAGIPSNNGHPLLGLNNGLLRPNGMIDPIEFQLLKACVSQLYFSQALLQQQLAQVYQLFLSRYL